MPSYARPKAAPSVTQTPVIAAPAASMGNAAAASMLGGLGGLALPDLSSLLPRMPNPMDLIPSFPTPELPIPGMPQMPQLPSLNDLIPDISLPQLPGLSDLPGYDAIAQGVDATSQLWQEEGINMLLDPVGALDRSQAREDLSSRFEVVGDDFVGPRNHNTVSQGEYDGIVQTYSDIRLGRGDLTIDTSEMSDDAQESTYRSGTMDQIADIMETSSGRDMIFQMSNNVMQDDAGNARSFIGDTDVSGSWMAGLGSEKHRQTTIRALYNDTNGNGDLTDDAHTSTDYNDTNAFADATGASGESGAIDVSGRSQWGRDSSGGRGAGTDSTIWFNPTVQAGNITAADSDVVLVHEMQHAMHETQGTMASGRYTGTGVDGTGSATGISNFERQAVGLTNTGDNVNDPNLCPENTYRTERNELGDNFLQRNTYRGTLPGRAPVPAPAPVVAPAPAGP